MVYMRVHLGNEFLLNESRPKKLEVVDFEFVMTEKNVIFIQNSLTNEYFDLRSLWMKI